MVNFAVKSTLWLMCGWLGLVGLLAIDRAADEIARQRMEIRQALFARVRAEQRVDAQVIGQVSALRSRYL